MSSLVPRVIHLTAAVLFTASSAVGAQPPQEQPPPPAQEEPTPADAPEVQPIDEETAEEPADDGPKPAGIGTSPEPTVVPMPSGRNYSGVFGGARPRGMRGQSLDLTMSAFGGWDEPEDLLVLPGEENERVAVAGPFSGGAATLFYTRPGQRLDLSGFGSGFVGYFPDNDDPWYPSYSAGLSANTQFRLGQRTYLRLAQVEGFATDLSLGQLGSGIGGGGMQVPRATGETAFDNSLRRAPSLTSSSQASVEHGLSTKTTLSTYYGYRNAYFFETRADRLPMRHDHHAGVRVRRRFTRDLSLRAGYTIRKSWTGREDEQPREFHDIDLGVDYSKSLPLSRRTQLYFSTGSTIAASESAADDDGGTFNDTRFFVVGQAGLLHEIGRSWSAQVGYTRDVGYEDGFADPFLRDAAIARVGGFIGRRVDVSASAQWTSAAVGLGERNFSAWTAGAQVRTAITQNLAAYGNYYYYLQDFNAGVALPPGVVRDLSRQGVRIGLTTWVPLWSSR